MSLKKGESKGIKGKIALAILIYLCCFIVNGTKVYAAEAVICHEHTGTCYEKKWISCEDRYEITNYTQDVYCSGCQKVSSAIIFVETYVCDYYGSYREFRRIGHCCNCPTVVLLQEKPESAIHGREAQVCVCGMDTNTVLAKADFTASVTEWTNQDVTLNVAVTEPVAGISNAPYTYAFSGGVANGTSCTVSENGTYSVVVTAANGKQMTASLQVNNIDKTPPQIIKCEVDKSYPEYTAANIVLVGKDEGSGLADNAYSFDGGKTFVASGNYPVTKNGTYSIVVKDKAGNCSSKSLTVTCFAKKQEVSNVSQKSQDLEKTQSVQPAKAAKVSEATKTAVKESKKEIKEDTQSSEIHAMLKEKLEQSGFRVPLEKIPGVYSSLMRSNAEKNAVPMTLNVVNEKSDNAYSPKTDKTGNLVKNITLEEKKNESGGTFAQVTKATVAGGVLLCIGMLVFLIVFLVKKQ